MLTITVDLIFIYSIYIEGARAGWILVADHPSACNHPVPAVLWSFYHSASGEGCPHRSCLIHTHTGMSLKITALFLQSLINIVIELVQRLFRCNLFFSWDFFRPSLVSWLSEKWSDTHKASSASDSLSFDIPAASNWIRNFSKRVYSHFVY